MAALTVLPHAYGVLSPEVIDSYTTHTSFDSKNMEESTLLHGNAYESYGVLSPGSHWQRSVRSESPELIDFYPSHSSVGGVKSETSFDSRGLGSSFVMVTDESNVGVPRDLSLNRSLDHGDDTKTAEPQLLAIQNIVTSAEPLLYQNVKASLKLPVRSETTEEKKIQTTPDIRDWSTQTSPVRKSSKQDPTASASNSIFQVDTEFSPFVVDPPSDEVVDMSASTVLVERHISQKEGRILKSSNKELRLKIKKLTEVLEQIRKESDKLRNEMESKSKDDDLKSAMILKEKELRRHIEELEDEHKLEVEKYKVELKKCKVKLEKYKVELEKHKNRSQEAEEGAQKKMVKNRKVIVELQSAINTLQEQIMESKKDLVKKSGEMVEVLLGKLQASETKNVITETEISVLNEKIDLLMKEMATLKKSMQQHHHQLYRHHLDGPDQPAQLQPKPKMLYTQHDPPQKDEGGSVIDCPICGEVLYSRDSYETQVHLSVCNNHPRYLIKCPICFKVLHSREKYGIELHVERCLQQSEAGLRN